MLREFRTGRLLLRPVVPEDLPVPRSCLREEARCRSGLNAACTADGARFRAALAAGS